MNPGDTAEPQEKASGVARLKICRTAARESYEGGVCTGPAEFTYHRVTPDARIYDRNKIRCPFSKGQTP